MVKTGVIKLEDFNAENYSGVVRNSFTDTTVGGESYKMLFAFSKYVDGYTFDKVFNSIEGFEKWKLEYEWKYFLIPLDLVPYISHYADFVKEAYPELIFDIVVESRAIEVEGTSVTIPHKQIKVIPCSCTRWTDEGVDLLDAVIENWNVTYPDKQINFQVAFESFEEFENFRNEQI